MLRNRDHHGLWPGAVAVVIQPRPESLRGIAFGDTGCVHSVRENVKASPLYHMNSFFFALVPPGLRNTSPQCRTRSNS